MLLISFNKEQKNYFTLFKMEQAHNNDFPPSSTLGTTPNNANPIDSSPLEVPRFLGNIKLKYYSFPTRI